MAVLTETFHTSFSFKKVLTVLIMILIILSFSLLSSRKETIEVNGQSIVIINSHHSVTKHGDGAIMSRRCFDHHGTWDVFMARFDKDNTFQLICRDTLGNYYTRIIERIKDNIFREKTAYQYASRNWNEIKNLILKSGEFVRYRGPLVPLP